MSPESDRLARIAIAHLVEPGVREVGVLTRRTGAPAALARLVDGGVSDRLAGAVAARLAAAPLGVDGTAALQVKLAAMADIAHAAVEHATRLGVRVVTPLDAEWPSHLGDLARIAQDSAGSTGSTTSDTDPPICLWVRGVAALDDALGRSVSIVGARASTSYGDHVAGELAYGLAERDWTVVSGWAFGIDAAAHRAALAAGGLTVAVLACGIDRPYPLAHASLFDRISDDGLLVSEWPPGSAPHRHRFLTRNRVIAAATRGTVVVEAASRSGARQTLGRARRLGRATMVVPGPVTSAMSVGCHVEVRQFDCRLVTNALEVIEEVGAVGELAPEPRGPERPYDALDPIAARVLDAVLPRKARTAEEIAAVAGVGAREGRRAMPLLEAAGFVVRHDDRYRLAPKPGPERRSRPGGDGAPS
jgi:DNA processing protein